MDDAEELAARAAGLVSGVEPIGHLHRDVNRDLGVHPTPALGQGGQELPEGDAPNVLHDQEVPSVALPQLFDVDDVGVRDPGGEERLVDEHPDEGRVLGEVLVDDLYRDVLGEPGRPEAAAQEERRHPARLELRDDLVVTDPIPCFEHVQTARQVIRRSVPTERRRLIWYY